MNRKIWDIYNPGDINDGIKYWVDIWEDLCDSLDGKSFEEFDHTSAHLTIVGLRDEVKERGFSHKELIALYKERLGWVMDYDPILSGIYKSEFSQLTKQLAERKDPNFFVHSCNYCLELFSSGKYFDNCLNYLCEMLMDDSQFSIDRVKSISYFLIIELYLAEYCIKSIRGFPTCVFDKYEVIGSESWIRTSYPHKIKSYDNSDSSKYSNDVKEFLDHITIRERILSISNFFYDEWKEGYFIFNLIGFYGNKGLKINDINIYSPQTFRYVTDQETNREFFGKSGDDVVNSAVFMKYRDADYSKNLVITKLNGLFDALRLYSDSEISFGVKENDYFVVYEGRIVQGQYSLGPEHNLYFEVNSFNLSKKSDDEFNYINNAIRRFSELDPKNNELQFFASKIQRSCLFFRKGFETDLPDSKHLNYWISIENIVKFNNKEQNSSNENNSDDSPLQLAKKIIPPVIIFNEIASIASDLFFYLWSGVRSSTGSSDGKMYYKFEIEESIQSQCQLNLKSGTIDFIRFLNKLPLLLEYVHDVFLHEKILFVYNFYFDKEFGRKYIDERKKEISNDLTLIYQIRNQIVHKAYVNEHMVFFYTKKAEKFSKMILLYFIHEFGNRGKNNYESILFRKSYDLNLLYDKLKNDVNFTIFDYYSNKFDVIENS